MAEILKEWLTERLRRPIKWEAEEFGELMMNGHIIACVLLSYNVINEEKHFLIRSSNAPEDVNDNWKYLIEWLREVEVYVSDSDLAGIKEGKGTALLRLFYQLFLHLDKRDRTNFIKRERKMVSTLVDKMKSRFTVQKIPEEETSFVDNLSKPLLDEGQYIEWQKKKNEQVKATYDYIRQKYSKMVSQLDESKTPLVHVKQKQQQVPDTTKNEMEKFALQYPCKFKNYTYEELIEMEEKSAQRRQSMTGSDWVKEYMDNLYSRMSRKTDTKEFQTQIRNVLSASLWDLSVAEEEAKLDKELAKKVMKLSQFEKQMCTKLMETKQQARNLVNNRAQAEREFSEQREQQFHQFLDNVKEQIHLEVAEINFEKQRQNMLHQKLYAEKIKRKRQHYYDICYETMLSIVDYASKYAYFSKLIGDEIPSHYIHQWKSLYFKQQPIFDILDPIEDLLEEPGSDEKILPEVEEIKRLELERQEALNDSEFVEYHNYSSPWTLDILIPNYDSESEERKYEYLGTRILGHLVYTLLDIKYPYPPLRPPAALPDYSAKALLRGLPDRSITVAMQTLLKLQKIFVLRLESAINYCLKQFKTEMIGCTDIELSFDKFIIAANQDPDKELIRLMKIDDEIETKSSELYGPAIFGPLPPNTKQTQTPKTIPEEEIVLSPAAELGKYTYETLNFGESLTDYLLAAMVVEYLKDQNDIKGFVIVNYPNSYREAQILEEAFSGRIPPDERELDDRDDIYLEQSIIKHRKKEKDQYKELRVSKLVNDPHKKRIEKQFESYFTCYIKLIETHDILQEPVLWDLTEENSDFIDRFYSVLGINYSMYYELIEKDFLAQICKYIIGDFVVPLKSYDLLFGENVLSLLDFPSSDDKRMKSKIVKPETSNNKSKEKLRQSSKISKSSNSKNELEVVKAPDSIDGETDENTMKSGEIIGEAVSKTFLSSEDIKLLPGEEDWNYGEIPIAITIGVALATCWEETEKTYINDMKQLFFAKRLQMNCLIPYGTFIKDKMDQIITLPSYKQDIVSRFQKQYNDFESDWRHINLTKNEWHCRVKELQSNLYNICDERKLFAEQQRFALICENWAMEELTCMVNTYVSCMQVELNRSILTYQALHDFYFAMIKHMPPNDRLSSKELTKIYKESEETSGSRKSGEDKVYRQLKNIFQDLQLKNVQIDYSNNPFNMIIENNVKFAIKVIKDTNDSYRSLISREYSEIAKIAPPIKKRDETTSEESINIEEIFKLNALKCIDEWIMGINGEMYRACLRMQALQYMCYREMKLFNDHIYKTFTEVQNNIDSYYMNEIKAVDRLCKYLQMAIEDGRKIPESLVLEHDAFVIDPNLIQFAPSARNLGLEELKEMDIDTEFKISQLARLRSSFKIIAPTGIALQQAFIYMLQDFICFGKESCNGPLVPEIWKRVDVEQIPKLVYLLFGENVHVDWRDFLIYCLNIRFPNVDELLHIRKRYRCIDIDSSEVISRDNFVNEELWYEKEFHKEDRYMQLRKNLIKHFIFELYETNENQMNYPAFLLAFCKNADPIEGFVTALSMVVGKKTCHSLEECEEVICKFIKEKKYRDDCLACALKCTNQFLDKLINAVIDICEATSVIELEYSEPPPDADKKGKKGKGGIKAKKLDSSQSARVPKAQKSIIASRSKVAQSETDVKATYICRPCENEVEPLDEKSPKIEHVEEEQKSVAQEDINLAYSVSQDAIWKVLKTCLPWHFVLLPEEKVTPYTEQVNSVLKRLEADTDNGDIYVCKFVSDPTICKILHKVKKFTAINITEEVRKIFL
ncbi:unnamed protein product [Chilo suppressalis]|uniref:Calponin-homology (CH) domain-containing protein n=1 Tax=Chilo suppressalis TaxID=168631 RepID=A0ABN8L2Z6_CHISP|nr:unnamed protein product [Chilo suppressalis]